MIKKTLFVLICFICSCTSEYNEKRKTDYYYVKNSDSGNAEIVRKKRFFHNEKDSLLSRVDFFYNKKKHTLYKYTSWLTTSFGYTRYELDTFGVISEVSVGEPFHMYLHCTNDTINNLFQFSFSRIIFENEQGLQPYYFQYSDSSWYERRYKNVIW